MLNRRASGQKWEREAEKFLHSNGLRTLKRNYHSRFGEIDLVMSDGEILVFVEVRYRRNAGYGSGADSVTPVKQQRIVRTAERYLQQFKVHPSKVCRFDVISISGAGKNSETEWITDAFEVC